MKISTKTNLGSKCKSTRERKKSAPPVGHVYSSVITRTSTHAGFNVQLASFLISLLEELGRHQFCNLDRQNSLKPGVFSSYLLQILAVHTFPEWWRRRKGPANVWTPERGQAAVTRQRGLNGTQPEPTEVTQKPLRYLQLPKSDTTTCRWRRGDRWKTPRC